MGFPRRLLHDDEEVVLDLRPHWWFLSGPVALVVAALVATGVVAGAGWPEPLQVAVIGVALAVTGWLVGRGARWATTSLTVTSHRLVARSGVVRRRGSELPLAGVARVTVRQRLFERLLGVGELVVESQPDGEVRSFRHVPRPRSVRDEVDRCVDERSDQDVGRRLSLPEQLERLEDLRRRGALTDEEFRAGKARLLSEA